MSDTDSAQNAPAIHLQRIYLKDGSFEAPNTPKVFNQNAAKPPMVEFHLHPDVTLIENDTYELVLGATVKVHHDTQVLFLVEVKQAGIFTLQNIPSATMDRVLHITCMAMLYPYLREAVSDLVARGSFPQLLLDPINFDHLYQQRVASLQKDTSAEVADPEVRH